MVFCSPIERDRATAAARETWYRREGTVSFPGNDRERKTMLLVYTGLLARYDQMTMLERLRDKVGRRDGIPDVWLLIPGDSQAMMDGKAIPLISPGTEDTSAAKLDT